MNTQAEWRIWKFVLGPDNQRPDEPMTFDVETPCVMTWLDAQMQGDVLCVWATVDVNAAKEKRVLHVVGTGHPMPKGLHAYIGTAQDRPRGLVWHVFVKPLLEMD